MAVHQDCTFYLVNSTNWISRTPFGMRPGDRISLIKHQQQRRRRIFNWPPTVHHSLLYQFVRAVLPCMPPDSVDHRESESENIIQICNTDFHYTRFSCQSDKITFFSSRLVSFSSFRLFIAFARMIHYASRNNFSARNTIPL